MEKILVTRSSMPPLNEYIDEISPIWQSHWLTNMGEKHQTLANLLKNYLQVENIELLVNGHMALEMVLQAMELKGEVITTPFSFASTTHAIVRNGLTPVFCDINNTDYTIDADKIESLITPQTSAIVPVHVYGNICNVEKIEKIAVRHGLKVIYDAAHTFGATYKGRAMADFGDAACLSFHATKVFNTIEGGAVIFHDKKLGEKLYNLKNFGIRDENSVIAVGANAKMNEFAAAMGICNLRHIGEEIAKRKKIVEFYNNELSGIDGLKLPLPQQNVSPNYAYYPILVNENVLKINRDEIAAALAKENIVARKYFYPLISDFDCYKDRYISKTPIAKLVAKSILTLPLYADLTLESVKKITKIIKNTIKI